MITHTQSIDVSRPPADVFAFATDFSNAPRWLEGCIELRPATLPLAVGVALHYSHRQTGSPESMQGVVTGLEPSARITMQFEDSKFRVEVVIATAPSAGGTTATHTISIEPKGFGASLLTPLITPGNRRQVETNLARLKALLEA